MVAFLRATLGFEQELMKEATEKLAIAETAAAEHRRRAHREGYQSSIYPIGSEYALCDAEAQLMTAVLAVLNESLTESVKGFYRLRKAYATLQEISTAEKKYIDQHRSGMVDVSRPSTASRPSTGRRTPSFLNLKSSSNSAAGSRPNSSLLTPQNGATPTDGEDSDLEFVDADEKHVET